MNCRASRKLIGEYIDGELGERQAARVAGHLESCAACANVYEQIQHEQMVYAGIAQQVEFNHPRWETVRSRVETEKVISLAKPVHQWFRRIQIAAPVAAVILISIAAVILVVALLNQKSTGEIPSQRTEIAPVPETVTAGSNTDSLPATPVANKEKVKTGPKTVVAERKLVVAERTAKPSFDTEKFRDPQATTLAHIEQSQMLLRSFRNAPEDIAVERQRFQKLLDRNVLLRCAAIAKGNLVEEEVLTTLEPILVEITNLPDRASAQDVRSITETMKKTEIVAMLQVYSQTNNR
jgi:DNA topoisomerase VI subunit B